MECFLEEKLRKKLSLVTQKKMKKISFRWEKKLDEIPTPSREEIINMIKSA